jgi:hypothetical protein
MADGKTIGHLLSAISHMILLFDVDGVLVHSAAYHAALRLTVAYFSRRLGLGEIILTDADVEVYESQSITVEWDSGAISVAALLMERLKAAPPSSLSKNFWEALDQLGAQPVAIDRPDFGALARRVGEATPPGGLPAHTALSLFTDEAGQGQALPLLHQSLSNCYEIDRAPAMQVFQNFVLGHDEYTRYYGLPAHTETEPLLEKLDRPLLRPDAREQLLARRAAGGVYAALYTARPSLPPAEAAAQPRGYTPEAETARKQCGLESLPAIGFGKVDWFAKQVGLSGKDLVKPSPVQSMAAIGAARAGLEMESLKAAFAVARGDHLRYPLSACAGETVHVFEDSPSSLRAAARGVGLLNRQGLNLRLVRHGVAPAGSPKRATLEKAADVVHEDVNEGLARIL